MNTAPLDDHGLQILDLEECMRLLGTASIGRVGLHWDALPTVLPVNFVLDGDRVVFRTGRGAKLAAAAAGNVVAFEVDSVEAAYREGWSVVITGVAHLVTAECEVVRLRSLPLDPWAPSPGNQFVAVDATLVTGRRLVRQPA